MEVYNNTGATIDFAETNYVLDDDDSNALAGANVTSGSIPQDGVAVLFNGSSLTVDQMQQAWGADVNFVPVQSWPGLA
ncbi:MAG: hypothetical protein KDA99_04940, partial [Planctomycetales bacterium]|nr:hypothetical protein [Planctomycetales bacterium]